MLQPLSDTPPHEVARAVFRQDWRDVAMLHWPVDPALVAPMLPPGTVPDLHDGTTYVGLVPFSMRGIRVLGTPPAAWLSAFPETNVRLYATDADGRRGVVFRSLDASRLLPVLAARASYRLPYCWSRMAVRRDGDELTYTCARRWPGPRGAGGRIRLRISGPMPSDPLARFLTARWGLFSAVPGGRTAWAPVAHEAWPLQTAEVLELKDDLVTAAGLPADGPPYALFSAGVSVRFGRPSLLPRATTA